MLEIFEPLGEVVDGRGACRVPRVTGGPGHAAYVDGRFDEAIACFQAAAALRPGDGPCRVFIARCADFARTGLPAGWDGAWHFDTK